MRGKKAIGRENTNLEAQVKATPLCRSRAIAYAMGRAGVAIANAMTLIPNRHAPMEDGLASDYLCCVFPSTHRSNSPGFSAISCNCAPTAANACAGDLLGTPKR